MRKVTSLILFGVFLLGVNPSLAVQTAISLDPVRKSLCDETAKCDSCRVDIVTETFGLATWIKRVDVIQCETQDGVDFKSCIYDAAGTCTAAVTETSEPLCDACKFRTCWTVGTAGSNGTPLEPTACTCTELGVKTWSSSAHIHECAP